MTTVSLSRFLLNLRGIAYRSDILSSTEISSPASHAHSLDFARFVGSLGNTVGDGISGFKGKGRVDEALEIENSYTIDSIPTRGIDPVPTPHWVALDVE